MVVRRREITQEVREYAARQGIGSRTAALA